MAAKAGFHALAVSAALVMASGAMQSDHAMAQADEAGAETGVVAAQADDAARANDAAPQEKPSGQPLPKQKPAAADRPAKSDLDQSAVRAAPVIRAPRLTRTSTRAIALPKILGSYR